MTLKTRRLCVLLLLGAGEFLWLTLSTKDVPTLADYAILVVVALAALVPALRNGFFAALQKTNHNLSSSKPITRAAIAIGIVATIYLYCTGIFTAGRELFPRVHDEHMHLLQMQMLAHGKFWITPPPDWPADFFETFHIIVKPVYAAIYFPGTALLYLPEVWLGLPFWIMPLLISGVIVGLTFWIVAHLIDGASGLVASLVLVSLTRFRWLSLRVMSYNVVLLMGLLMFVAYLNWRRTRNWKWAMLIGFFAGWAAITRPVDALCFAVPIGISMLIDLCFAGNAEGRTQNAEQNTVLRSAFRVPTSAFFVILGAAPLLVLQIIFNFGITGKLLETPYRYYSDRFSPQISFGFHEYDPNIRPQTNLPQRLLYHERFNVPEIKSHKPSTAIQSWFDFRTRELLHATLPNPLIYWLLPAGLMALTTRSRWIFFGVIPVFILFYTFFAFLMAQYMMAITPSVIFLLLLSVRAIEDVFPNHRPLVATFFMGLIIAFSLASLNEFHPGQSADDEGDFRSLRFANLELPKLVKTPAVVLFTFHRTNNVHDEPVFNVETPWPDDAAIVRAQDLGSRNTELFHYYADHQPDRNFYIFDRSSRELQSLGTAREIVAKEKPATRSTGD